MSNSEVRKFRWIVMVPALAFLGGCVTGTPIHARKELAKENSINRIAVLGSGRVVWPRMGGREPVVGLEASKQTLDATLPLVKAELASKGYQPIVAEPVGIFANPAYKQDWVFPASGEFEAVDENAGEQQESSAPADKTANFGKPYQVESKKPVFVYDGYAKDESALASAKSVFDFLDQIPADLPVNSKIGESSPSADALRLLGSRTGADTLCFARVTGHRFTKARKAGAVALNAATIWFGVVVLPPTDSAAINLTCYDSASGKLAWHSAYGAYLGDPEKPSGAGLKHGLKYFPVRGQPMLVTCKLEENKASLFSCNDS